MTIAALPVFDCVSAIWSPGIGDPDLYGWLGVALYGLAAALAVLVARRGPFPPGHHQRGAVLWLGIAVLMAFLALNKQLDLHTLLITAGRCLSRDEGWYESRRMVQRDFILALALVMALVVWATVRLFGFLVRGDALLLSGLAAVAGFVLIRAMHFFHVIEPTDPTLDRLVHALTTALELIGPTLVLAAEGRILRGGTQRSTG